MHIHETRFKWPGSYILGNTKERLRALLSTGAAAPEDLYQRGYPGGLGFRSRRIVTPSRRESE